MSFSRILLLVGHVIRYAPVLHLEYEKNPINYCSTYLLPSLIFFATLKVNIRLAPHLRLIQTFTVQWLSLFLNRTRMFTIKSQIVKCHYCLPLSSKNVTYSVILDFMTFILSQKPSNQICPSLIIVISPKKRVKKSQLF